MNIADDIEDVDTTIFPYNMEKYVQKNRQKEKNEQQHQWQATRAASTNQAAISQNKCQKIASYNTFC